MIVNVNSRILGHNTRLPLERSPPVSFKRLLGLNPSPEAPMEGEKQEVRGQRG